MQVDLAERRVGVEELGGFAGQKGVLRDQAILEVDLGLAGRVGDCVECINRLILGLDDHV